MCVEFCLKQQRGKSILKLPLKLIYFNWKLITLQYCSAFCHTLTWISHGWTCVPQDELFSWSSYILSDQEVPSRLPSCWEWVCEGVRWGGLSWVRRGTRFCCQVWCGSQHVSTTTFHPTAHFWGETPRLFSFWRFNFHFSQGFLPYF